MGKLGSMLEQFLIKQGPKYKQYVLEERLRNLLGAKPFSDVSGLPKRRGNADGGIDGTINISYSSDPHNIIKAFNNIKLRKSAITREQLGGVLLDSDREGF